MYFVLFVSSWCPGSQAQQSRAQREEHAIELLEQKRFAQARAELESLLGDDPANTRIEAYLAAAELHSGDAAAAIARLRRLLESDPGNTDLRVLLGQAYLDDGNWALAEKEWRGVLDKRPNSEEAHTQRARALLQLGRFEEGLKEAARATEINPRRSDAWALEGNTLASLGRIEEGVNAWNRALAGDPNNSAALAGLAVYLRSRQPDVALEYARRAVELSQWSAVGPIRILSLVYRSRGEYIQARQAIEKGLQGFPNDPSLAAELRLINAEEQAARGQGNPPAKPASPAGQPPAAKKNSPK